VTQAIGRRDYTAIADELRLLEQLAAAPAGAWLELPRGAARMSLLARREIELGVDRDHAGDPTCRYRLTELGRRRVDRRQVIRVELGREGARA
jgi:hypothetical protein